MSKKYTVNQGCMSLSTDYLKYGRHLARLHCRRRRRRAYAPTSSTASCDNREKITSWVSFNSLYSYGAPLRGPSGRRSSSIKESKLVYLNGNNAAKGENNIKYANSYPMN